MDFDTPLFVIVTGRTVPANIRKTRNRRGPETAEKGMTKRLVLPFSVVSVSSVPVKKMTA